MWGMAWAETGLHLACMALAMASAGGPRTFFQPAAAPPSPSKAQAMLSREERTYRPTNV